MATSSPDFVAMASTHIIRRLQAAVAVQQRGGYHRAALAGRLRLSGSFGGDARGPPTRMVCLAQLAKKCQIRMVISRLVRR